MSESPPWWQNRKPYAMVDCLEGLSKIPPRSVGLVIAQPPVKRGIEIEDDDYDETSKPEYKAWVKEWFGHCKRIARNIVVMPGVLNIYLYPKPDWICCWDKGKSEDATPFGMSSWEPILVYGDKVGVEIRDMFVDRFDAVSSLEYYGPRPMPVNLCREIVIHFSKVGDVVVDPFLGTGTTLLVCRATNRIGLGFEVNPYYEPLIEDKMLDKVMSLDEFNESTDIVGGV